MMTLCALCVTMLSTSFQGLCTQLMIDATIATTLATAVKTKIDQTSVPRASRTHLVPPSPPRLYRKSTLLLTPLPRRQNLSAESVRWGRRGLVRWSHGRHDGSNIMGDGTSSVKSALNMRGRCTQRSQRSRRWQQRAAPAVVVADGAGREGGRRRRRRRRETGRKRRQA